MNGIIERTEDDERMRYEIKDSPLIFNGISH
jgi:hypothetical protein